jgi:FkbM family methyltransferase
MILKIKILVYKVIFKFFRISPLRNFDVSKEILRFFGTKGFQTVLIGANDVVSFDNIEEVLEKSTRVVLIEPHPKYFQILQEKYLNNKKYILISRAIHLTEENMNLYSVSDIGKYETWVQGISSFNINHLIQNKIHPNDIQVFKVNCVSVEDLLSNYTLKNVPLYIQIDVEGYDFEVFKGINFNKFLIKFLKIEIVHLKITEVIKIRTELSRNKFVSFQLKNDLIAIR